MSEAPVATRAVRLSDFIVRRHRWLFGCWWLHVWLLHYFVIGFISWDGFKYRSVPIVELVQHGSLGADRYLEWAQVGYLPFVELVHIPFLLVLGIRGFLVGFPLLVFPLCVIAVYRLVAELTSSKQGGVYGAIAYCALPVINQQPFSGYVDFAVTGILAYFIFAALRLKSDTGWRPVLRFGIATFLLGMARAQGVYIGVCLVAVLGFVLCCERRGWRIEILLRRKLVLLAAAFVLGSVPAIAVQIYKYKVYGSPLAPYRLQLLGLDLGTGMPMSRAFRDSGLDGMDLGSILKGFVHGWLWSPGWPLGAFFDSRQLGGGLLMYVAIALLPTFWRHATRVERWLLVGGAVISVLAGDFGLPRYAYTTMISISMIVGRAAPQLAHKTTRGGIAAFAAVLVILGLHFLRPELDVAQIQAGYLAPRIDVANSPLFEHGIDSVQLYPNNRLRFVIVDQVNFTLRVFGSELSNEVLGSVRGDDLGVRCSSLHALLDADPGALVIDEGDQTAGCQRACAMWWWGYCAAWKIKPGP